MKYKIQSLDALRSTEWKTLSMILNDKKIEKTFESIKDAGSYMYLRCNVPVSSNEVKLNAEYWSDYPKNTQFRIVEA